MSKKVFLGIGHGGNDSGAVGARGIKEKDLNLSIGQACRDELERHGILVLMSRTKDENDPLSEEIKECNLFNPDLAIDIHNNAGGGDGFEAYYSVASLTSKQAALNIEAEIKSVGQNSRGCKVRKRADGRDYYGFIRQIKAPAVLVECAFVDTQDVNIIDESHEQRIMGIAIAKGIIKSLGIKWTAPNSIKYYVKVCHFGKLEDAEKASEKIKNLHGWYNVIGSELVK